ncbi:hypothetical protein FGB62_8g22 [Gracilaria domingensis]|nr:hypothetical protein FGB62_8g22 [Gracilaria domingensis]
MQSRRASKHCSTIACKREHSSIVKDGCQVNDKEDGLAVSSHMLETDAADLEHNSTTKNQYEAFGTVKNITVEPDTVEKFGNQDGDMWNRKAVTHFGVFSKHFGVFSKHHSHIHWHGKKQDRPDRVVNVNVMQEVVEGIGALRVNEYQENPVQVRVSHPERSPLVTYLAVFSVDVLVKNVSNGVMDVAFAAPLKGGVADGERGRYWTGDISMSLGSIAPGAERTICLTAVLISPGQYNMCRFIILYQSSSFVPNRRMQQIYVSSSYMTVEAVGEYKLREDDMTEKQHETAPLRRSSRRISTGSSGMLRKLKLQSPGPNEDTTTGSKHSKENKTLGHGSGRKNDEVDLNIRKRVADAKASRASEWSDRDRERESTLRDVSPARSGRGTSPEGKSVQLFS